MPVEVHYNGGDPRVPKAHTPVRVANSEDIRIRFTLRDGRDERRASSVAPSAEQLALLYIPAEDFLVGSDIDFASARASSRRVVIFIGRPYRVCGGGGYNAKDLRLLIFPRCIGLVVATQLHRIKALTDTILP